MDKIGLFIKCNASVLGTVVLYLQTQRKVECCDCGELKNKIWSIKQVDRVVLKCLLINQK